MIIFSPFPISAQRFLPTVRVGGRKRETCSGSNSFPTHKARTYRTKFRAHPMQQRRRNAVVIGGGPVGLYTAWRLAQSLDSSSWRITLVEMRPEYTRENIIFLTDDTFTKLPHQVLDALVDAEDSPGCYYRGGTDDPLSICYEQFQEHILVSISLLEKEMLRFLRYYPTVRIIRPSPGQPPLKVVFDEASSTVYVNGEAIRWDILIGADGANSRVRRELLHAGTIPFFPNVHLFGVTLTAKTTREDLGGVFRNTRDLRNYLNDPTPPTRRNPGRVLHPPRPSKVEIEKGRYLFRSKVGDYFIGLAVNEEEYEMLLRDPLASPFLWEKVASLCRQVRAKCLTEPSAYNVRAFPIVPSMADRVANDAGTIFIVGDAAISTHFLTGAGVGTGIEAAEFLVKQIQIASHNWDAGGPDPALYTVRVIELAEAMHTTLGDVIKEIGAEEYGVEELVYGVENL